MLQWWVVYFLDISGTPTTDACDYVKQLANSQVTVEVVQVTGLQVRIIDSDNHDVGDAVRPLMQGTKIPNCFCRFDICITWE